MKFFKSMFVFCLLALFASVALAAPEPVPIGFTAHNLNISVSINKSDLLACLRGEQPASGVACPERFTAAHELDNHFAGAVGGLRMAFTKPSNHSNSYFMTTAYDATSIADRSGGLVNSRDYAASATDNLLRIQV